MKPADLLIADARVLTLDPSISTTSPGANTSTDPLGVISRANVHIRDGRILSVTPLAANPHAAPPSALPAHATVIRADGNVLMPAFVDCHTHLCWAGSRLDEWERKLAGASYLDILAAGGGIMSTVRAVREASESLLADLTLQRLESARSLGTTAIEIKSGYGLSTEHELKMLRAIALAASKWPGAVRPTALLAHAIDPDLPREDFIRRTIDETLPAVHAEFPAIPIDAYCEQGAWSLDECDRLFRRALDLGHPVRVHADQFNSLGMVRRAIELGALSVDHLEATTPEDWAALSASSTVAVILPCCGFHLDNRYASPRSSHPARADAPSTPLHPGAPTPSSPFSNLCIATNCNPGSAPCFSVPMALALAVRHCGVPIPDAIRAVTATPARLLGLKDRGMIRAGLRADLLLLSTRDERDLAYRIADPSLISRTFG